MSERKGVDPDSISSLPHATESAEGGVDLDSMVSPNEGIETVASIEEEIKGAKSLGELSDIIDVAKWTRDEMAEGTRRERENREDAVPLMKYDNVRREVLNRFTELYEKELRDAKSADQLFDIIRAATGIRSEMEKRTVSKGGGKGETDLFAGINNVSKDVQDKLKELYVDNIEAGDSACNSIGPRLLRENSEEAKRLVVKYGDPDTGMIRMDNFGSWSREFVAGGNKWQIDHLAHTRLNNCWNNVKFEGVKNEFEAQYDMTG
ncbi:MAG: hypothetical protein ABII72_03415 [Parcubacteria group bacterium]